MTISDQPLTTGPAIDSTTGMAQTDDEMAVYYDQSWLTSISRPLLIAVLTSCLTISLLAFLRYAIRGIPTVYTGVMVLLAVIATLVGCISTTWLRQPGQRMKRNSGLRLAELGLLVGITRLMSWVTVGNWPSLELLLTRPVDTVMDGPFVFSLLVVGMAWFMASAITSDFLKISLQPDEIYAAQQRTGRSGDDPTPPNYTDRRGVLSGFVTKWIGGGVLMVMLSAGTQIEPSSNGLFALGRQNIDPVVITATIIYFLTGLILVSQGQFAVLRARWTLEKVPSSASVVRNWPLYATMMIGGIGLLATLLPFGGTFYFYRILSSLIQGVYYGMMMILQFVFGLFGLLMALLMGESPPEPEAPPAPPVQPFQMPEPVPDGGGPPPWLGGTIFWIMITLLLGYALYIYLSGRGVNFGWLSRFWALLVMRIRELFGAYGEWSASRRFFPSKPENVAEDGKLAPGWLKRLRLEKLTPDQQVRYFYMTLLEEAKEAGIGRRNAETPSHYSPRLSEELHPPPAPPGVSDEMLDDMQMADEPDAEAISRAESARQAALSTTSAQVGTITDAFLQVRYAGTAADPSRLDNLKGMWEDLKQRIAKVHPQEKPE